MIFSSLRILFLLLFLFSCSNDISRFMIQKKKMEQLHGPCYWEYVGIDSQINYPAITLKPMFYKEYVLWNQICEKLKLFK